MKDTEFIRILKQEFELEPEVFEVAMYAISTIHINDAVTIATMSKSTEVRGIAPESYHLMKRFDNGLTLNKFWLENFAPIKMQLVISDIKLNTMQSYIQFGENKDNKDALKQARAIQLSKMDVLTTIAFMWKGVQYAEEFDKRIRLLIQLPDEHETYFKNKGI